MQLLATTILWTLIIYIFVTIHFLIIEHRKKTPNHAISFAIALGLGIWISYALYSSLTMFLTCVLYLGLEFWMLFNLLLNFFRQKDDILHLGKESWFDRMEARMKNPGATLALKFVLWIICSFILLDLPNPWA